MEGLELLLTEYKILFAIIFSAGFFSGIILWNIADVTEIIRETVTSRFYTLHPTNKWKYESNKKYLEEYLNRQKYQKS